MFSVYKEDEAVFLLLSIAVLMAARAQTAPEIYRGGFVPVTSADQTVSGETTKQETTVAPEAAKERSDTDAGKSAAPRFGVTPADGGNIELGLTLTAPFLNIPLTTGAHQYGGTSAYAPLKYDLGGLVMAGALAIGSIFLLPKFLPASDDFLNNGLYPPGHGRSDLEKTNGVNQTNSAFVDVIKRLDESLLSHYHIDSTACAYRVICNAVQSAKHAVNGGKPSPLDSIVHVITKTPVLKGYIPSAWREIAEEAWSTGDAGCSNETMEKRCPINADIAKAVLGALMHRSSFK